MYDHMLYLADSYYDSLDESAKETEQLAIYFCQFDDDGDEIKWRPAIIFMPPFPTMSKPLYHTSFSILLNKIVHKTPCCWCGTPITHGETCRESTDTICREEEDHYHEQEWEEEQYRREYEDEEERKQWEEFAFQERLREEGFI